MFLVSTFKSILNKLAASWENQQFAYAKTKSQIAVTAKLISAFVFATRIGQSLYFLNAKFHVSSCFLLLHRPVCVGPVRKPHCWFSHEVAQMETIIRCTWITKTSTPRILARCASLNVFNGSSKEPSIIKIAIFLACFLPPYTGLKAFRLIL